MSINGLSLQQDATSATIVGGIAMPLSGDGVDVKNGLHVADMAQADFTIRTNATFRTRNPVRQADGSYSKGKRFMTLVVPKDLGDDGIVFNLIRVEIEVHPKTTVAEMLNLHLLGTQLLSDTELTAFLNTGSLL